MVANDNPVRIGLRISEEEHLRMGRLKAQRSEKLGKTLTWEEFFLEAANISTRRLE